MVSPTQTRSGPKIINIVSGKGGTGKSLISALLGRLLGQEGANVLLVDFDLYVRGLSHMYYLFIKERRVISEKNKTISDLYDISFFNPTGRTLAIKRFFEADLLPAVSEIDEQLRYLDMSSNNVTLTKNIMKRIKSLAEYDYILLDNRAGVDEIIISTCLGSDTIISVSEADPIAQTTNNNLLRHLAEYKTGKVYTIINKDKFLKTIQDYEITLNKIRSDFFVLGHIPFDADLFDAFGTETFWDVAGSTKFAFALAESWNKLAQNEGYRHFIGMNRFKISRLWPSESKYPTLLTRFEQLSLVMGIGFLAYYLVNLIITGGIELQDLLLVYVVVLMSLPIIRRFLR